ncbi:MAG: hypothetical protein ABI696_03555, partial [Rubrivivax sp.]
MSALPAADGPRAPRRWVLAAGAALVVGCAVRPAAQRGAMLPSLVERVRARGLEPGGAAPLTTWSHAVGRARLAPLRAL